MHIISLFQRPNRYTDGQKDMRYNLQQLYGVASLIVDLTYDITPQKINQVIQDWPSHKAPGPDGFTGEFYKAFQQLIMPDLLATYYSVIHQSDQTLEPLNG
jgi:hypothetical protein